MRSVRLCAQSKPNQMVAQGNKRLKEPEINLYSSDDFDGLAILGARPEPPRFDRRYGFLIQSEPERFEHLDIDRTPDRIDFYVEDHSAHEVADPGRLPVLRGRDDRSTTARLRPSRLGQRSGRACSFPMHQRRHPARATENRYSRGAPN